MASINLQKVVRRFSREEGDFFVFTLTSVDVIEEPPTLQDPILSIPGTLFVSICREHSSTKVWIRTVDETWELGRDGDLHPLKPHRCLSISEAGANWVLLKTRQTYKQRNPWIRHSPHSEEVSGFSISSTHSHFETSVRHNIDSD